MIKYLGNKPFTILKI